MNMEIQAIKKRLICKMTIKSPLYYKHQKYMVDLKIQKINDLLIN